MGCSGSRISEPNFKYCICIDGSEHSDMGFKKIVSENFVKGNKLYLVHISNSAKFNEIPPNLLPDQLLNRYEIELSTKLNKGDYEIIKKDKVQTQSTVLESVLQIANVKNVDLLVVGALGHKGVKRSKSLTKGLSYLVSNCKIPTLVMKNYLPKQNKESKGSNWLVCIKDETDRSFRAFNFCCQMINRQTDTIIGLHFNSESYSANKVRKIFERNCSDKMIKKKLFIVKDMDKNMSLAKNILDYLIFGQENIEYVVVNHNIKKYKDIEKCPTVELVKYGNHNIIFCRE